MSFSNKSFSVRIYLGFQKNIGKSAFFLLSCFSSQKLRRLWSARALSSKHEQLLPRLNGKERWYEETPSLKIKLLTRPFFFSLSSKRAPFPSFRKEQPPEFFSLLSKNLSLSDAKLSLSLSLYRIFKRENRRRCWIKSPRTLDSSTRSSSKSRRNIISRPNETTTT